MAFKDVMLDLETMGVGSNPCITEIAAVEFDRNTGETGKEFHVGVDLQSCLDNGFDVTASTVNFWMSQNEDARESFLESQRESLYIGDALLAFNDYMSTVGYCSVWGNGTMADNRWLESAYEKLGIKSTIPFWAHADVRTVVDIAKSMGSPNYKSSKFEGVPHNPVDDCKHQIKYLVNYLNFIKG